MDMVKRMKLVSTIEKMKSYPEFCEKITMKDSSYIKAGSNEICIYITESKKNRI